MQAQELALEHGINELTLVAKYDSKATEGIKGAKPLDLAWIGNLAWVRATVA